MNERDGNRYDWFGNTLTAANGPERADGHVGFAVELLAASSQRLSCRSTAALSMSGGTGWWVWGWVRLASLPASNATFALVSKQDDTVGREFSVFVYNNGGSLYQLTAAVKAPDNSEVTTAKTITPDTTDWHLWEAWFDPDAGHVAVAWDHSAPTTTAKATPTRTASADLQVGSLTHLNGFLNGAIGAVHVRKQAPTQDERDEVWAGGAGVQYPFGPPVPGSATVTIDNAGGSSAVQAGAVLLLWLPPSFFDLATPAWPNGDDLMAEDAGGNPLKVWPEEVDAGNRYGRAWVETPSVAAGHSADITLRWGDPAQFSSADYDTLLAKRTADEHTVALYHLDTFGAGTTPEAGAGTAMALVGSPTQQATDGGNFRVRVPVQRFATGGHLSLNGTSQYASVAGLLDTPPAEGCVHLWAKLDTDPTAGARLLAKINAYSGSTVTEGLEVVYDTSGQLVARITAGGVAHDARFETFGQPGYPHPAAGWAHVLVSWGTKLRLIVNGILHAQAAHVGAWGDNSGGTAFTVGARLLASAASFAPVSIDEVEVRDAEPARAEYLSWFNRGASPVPFEFDRWTASPDNPVVDNVAHTAIEPRLERLGAGAYVGVHGSGSASAASLYPMSSTDGKSIISSETPVMGNGAGGWAGDAVRGNVFNDAGTLYLYWSDAIGTTGGSLHYATTDDDGATWTYGGVLLEPDAVHGGWANSTVAKVGSTYYWMVEYSTSGGGDYRIAHLRSSSPTGPLTLIDDRLCDMTLRVGTGSYSVGRLLYIAGAFHLFPHISYTSNLPSAVHHFESADCQRWQPRGGGDPVREIDFAVLPRQDQAADAYVYAIPESGEVGLLHDVDDNHGGGGVTAICLSTFTGALADLADEYPQLVLGSGPSQTAAAALLMVA